VNVISGEENVLFKCRGVNKRIIFEFATWEDSFIIQFYDKWLKDYVQTVWKTVGCWGILIGSFHVKSTQVTTRPPQNLIIFCEIVVPMEISIPAKFYCLWPLEFWEQTSKVVRKLVFLATSCLRKSGITSALIEIQSSFYAHFKANKMPFPVTYYTNIFSTVMYPRSSYLTFDLVFLKMYFNFLEKNIQWNLDFMFLNLHFPWFYTRFYRSHQNFHKSNVKFSWNICLCFLPNSSIIHSNWAWACCCHFKYFQLEVREKKIDFQL
jgi:hypothetical protein